MSSALTPGRAVGAGYLFSAAYLDSFDPGDLSANYLADIGISPNPRGSYSFAVPAGATFVVVVHTISTATECSGYAVTVSDAHCTCTVDFSDVLPTITSYSPVNIYTVEEYFRLRRQHFPSV